MWDAESGSAVGKPFEGHTKRVLFVADYPDRHHIISKSNDSTVQTWGTETASIGPSSTSKSHLICMHCQTLRVGSGTQKAAYCIGYHLTLTKAYIHLLSSHFQEHPTFGLSLDFDDFIFRTSWTDGFNTVLS